MVRKHAWFAAALLIGGSLGSCQSSPEAQPDREVLANYPCDKVTQIPESLAIALTGGPTFENEAHDCQRLVLVAGGDSLRFGPLVGVFPLDTGMENDFRGGPLATIYNWGSDGGQDSYAELNIPSAAQDPWTLSQAQRVRSGSDKRHRDDLRSGPGDFLRTG